MLVWVGFRISNHDPKQSSVNCPFFERTPIDFYFFEIPTIFLLICNIFFLLWITVVSRPTQITACTSRAVIAYMQIVVSKLRERTAMDHDRKHWKAAKALIGVMPLIGFGYLFTIVGPDKDRTPLAYSVYQVITSVLLSTQVFIQPGAFSPTLPSNIRYPSSSYCLKKILIIYPQTWHGNRSTC